LFAIQHAPKTAPNSYREAKNQSVRKGKKLGCNHDVMGGEGKGSKSMSERPLAKSPAKFAKEKPTPIILLKQRVKQGKEKSERNVVI
jgi:hypothetical protein